MTDTLTRDEAARRLRVHRDTITKLIAERGLPAFEVGGNYRIDRADLERWIAAQKLTVIPTGELHANRAK